MASPTHGQQVDISLHPTAVSDSFEVRLTSSTPNTGLISGTFTVRWETEAGGLINNQDLAANCGGYSFSNFGGIEDVLGHRYFTINFFGDRPLHASGCSINEQGMALGGLRIRELSGCRQVELVDNAFTLLNNYNYYVTVGGMELTGAIISGALVTGNCPPCVPAGITSLGASTVPYCNQGVDLWATASGTSLDFSWYDNVGETWGWLPAIHAPNGQAGTYTVVVSNVCGADTATIEALLDPELCIPPAIDSAWHEPGAGSFGSPPGIILNVALSGNCLAQSWYGPWGAEFYADPDGSTIISLPPNGTYTYVATNACGSDTVELPLFVEPMDSCSGPVVNSVEAVVVDPCVTQNVQFNATWIGPGPMLLAWYGPNDVQLTNATQFTLGHALWGSYTFVATNYCTSDSMTLFLGGTDTTGLAACQPPEILALDAVPFTCAGDTLVLVTDFVLTGPCAQLEWSNADVFSSQGDTTWAVASGNGPITLTASNACGVANAAAPIVVGPVLVTQSHQLCSPTGLLALNSLFQSLLPPGDGYWMHDGEPYSGIYDPDVDTTGWYHYYITLSDGLSCPVFNAILFEYHGAYAGEDSSIVACTNDPPFPLLSLLGGSADEGGDWSFNAGSVGGLFNPSIDPPGVYTYHSVLHYPMLFACADHAQIIVEVEEANVWYADVDGDGYGDTTDTVLACAPPIGHVANADDDCPEVYGLIGDACNDGDTATVNDMIDEDCLCAGELPTTVAEQQSGSIALWPNPNHGDAFFLQLPPTTTGKMQITIDDATGRRVLHRETAIRPGALRVALPSGLAAGTYVVGIVSRDRAEFRRLVVGR